MPEARARRLYRTFEHLIHELAKFGVVGAVAFAVTIVLFNAFHFGLGIGPLTSNAIAIIVTAIGSYFANRHWTWRHLDNAAMHRQLPMFLALSAVGLGITEVPLAISEYALGLHSKLAANISVDLIGTGLGTVWRFWSFKRWVFVGTPTELQDDEARHEALV